ncbi:MAG: hypothetical protein ACTHMZ_13325 [Actinomycetes bacterium]
MPAHRNTTNRVIVAPLPRPVKDARRSYEQVQRLEQDFVAQLRGLAIVDVDADGRTHVDTPTRIVGAIGAPIGRLNQSGIDAVLKTSLSQRDERELAEDLAGQR